MTLGLTLITPNVLITPMSNVKSHEVPEYLLVLGHHVNCDSWNSWIPKADKKWLRNLLTHLQTGTTVFSTGSGIFN